MTPGRATPGHPSTSGSAAFPAALNRFVVLGAGAWVLSVAFFVVQAIAQAASSVPYHLTSNVISDLGNTACGPDVCSPLHVAVNVTFVVVGMLHIGGAFLTHAAWPADWKRDAARTLLVIAGIGLVAAGSAPENVNPDLHSWGALTGLISLNAAMVFYGWSLGTAGRLLAALTGATGFVGFAGFLLFLSGPSVGPPGITERIADYPATLMVVVLGVYLLIAAASGRRGVGRRASLNR